MINNGKEFEIDIMFKNGKTIHLENCQTIESVIDFSTPGELCYSTYMYIAGDTVVLENSLTALSNMEADYYNIMKYVYDEGSSTYVKSMLDTVHIDGYSLVNNYVRRDGEDTLTKYIEFRKTVKK